MDCKRNKMAALKRARPKLNQLAFWNLNQIARYYGIANSTLINEIDRCKDNIRPFPKPAFWISGQAKWSVQSVKEWMESPAKYVKIGGKITEMGDVDKGDD